MVVREAEAEIRKAVVLELVVLLLLRDKVMLAETEALMLQLIVRAEAEAGHQVLEHPRLMVQQRQVAVAHFQIQLLVLVCITAEAEAEPFLIRLAHSVEQMRETVQDSQALQQAQLVEQPILAEVVVARREVARQEMVLLEL
jgi:hypothetical protein